MGFMHKALNYPHTINITRNAEGRCGFLNYVKMERRQIKTWKKPNSTQGPTAHGLDNPYCSDIAGFGNKMFQSDGVNYMEYLVIEYAQDVANQTPETETTQETTALYLKKQLLNKNMTSDDNVCVINTGLHNQRLCHDNITSSECEDVYLQNVAKYLKVLDSVCGNFVWIGISSVLGREPHIQRNNVSMPWNEGVKSLGLRLFPTKYFYIDVWNASSTFPHRDNVHFQPPYYQGLAALFTRLMM